MPQRSDTPSRIPRAIRIIVLATGSVLMLTAPAFGAPAASSAAKTWADAQIREVTRVGILGSSLVGFDPEGVLTEQALAAAIARVAAAQTPPSVPSPPADSSTSTATTTTTTTTTTAPPTTATTTTTPTEVEVLSTIPSGATIAGTDPWEISVPSESVASVAFAVDEVQLDVEAAAPYSFDEGQGGLVTTTLPNGAHQLAVAVHLLNGATYVAEWTIEVDNTPGAALTPLPSNPTPVPITQAPATAATPVTTTSQATPSVASAPVTTTATPSATVASHELYRAESPSRPVTIRQLDSAIVEYLGLGPAAAKIETTLRAAGLDPPPNTGSEVVARLLNLRITHPTPSENALDLLPNQNATRAEAAYSFAQLLGLSQSSVAWVTSLVSTFEIPRLNVWQRRILTTAVRFIGYPYVWGGTSPATEAPFGVEAPGGFDCSGFVWRVYKLTPYPNEGDLAGVIRGRTTYEMSGEVPASERIPAAKLEPGDVMFFGIGPRSKPSQVDHAAIYVGDGWLIQSSGEGVTLDPTEGWYAQSFAWARRPLREAGLT